MREKKEKRGKDVVAGKVVIEDEDERKRRGKVKKGVRENEEKRAKINE